jgi:hypothetical protein
MASERPVSVTAAVEHAASWTKKILFDRFTWAKWFTLGFCAFLADLGRGGAGIQSPGNWGNQGHDATRMLRHAAEWITDHMGLIMMIGIPVFLLLFALGVLLSWLSSRGTFMFMDGVVTDRAAVEEPWFRFKRIGNSLFFFQLVLGLAIFVLFVMVGTFCWMIARPSLSMWRFDGSPFIALFLGLLVILPIALASLVVHLLLRDFVTPIMYKRDLLTMEAFKVFFEEVLAGRAGALFLFYLLKLALGIGAIFVITLGTCLTCCIAGLPYISSVVFLPIHVFFRCYSLYFLEQVSERYRFFEAPAPPSPPAPEPDAFGFEEPGPAPDAGTPPELPPPANPLPPSATDV